MKSIVTTGPYFAYLQCNITELPQFVELAQRVVEVLPCLVGLKDKRSIWLRVSIRPGGALKLLLLLLELMLLGMFRHHITWGHHRLQGAKPREERSKRMGDKKCSQTINLSFTC